MESVDDDFINIFCLFRAVKSFKEETDFITFLETHEKSFNKRKSDIKIIKTKSEGQYTFYFRGESYSVKIKNSKNIGRFERNVFNPPFRVSFSAAEFPITQK